MNKLTKQQLHQEVIDISLAMTNWIQSQNLEPKMAAAAMARIVADIMVDQSKTKYEVQRKYEIFGEMLFGMVRSNWRKYHDEEEEEK